jgi:predicted enzyme related to lactoylglutathione lyase
MHFEIPADDMDRAQEFYRSAFGWEINAMPDMGYAMLHTTATDDQGAPKDPGAINGGMFKRQGPMTAPTVVIDVEDIDKALEIVNGLGAETVVPRQPVMEMGFSAYIKDPEGNLIGLWQSA